MACGGACHPAAAPKLIDAWLFMRESERMNIRDRGPAPATMPGQFWLPGSKEVVVSGRLSVGAGAPSLELDGMLTPAMQVTNVNIAEGGSAVSTSEPVDWEDEASLTIHGDVAMGAGTEQVTLVSGFTTGRN